MAACTLISPSTRESYRATDARPSWQRDLARAIDANSADLALMRLWAPTVRMPDRMEAAMRVGCEYRFTRASTVDAWSVVRARGWGACADAAALVAAVGLYSGMDARICIEATDRLPGYSHARVMLTEGRTTRVYDPFAAKSAQLGSCAVVYEVDDLPF